jgi:NodT family efflux transporter outer membrane factor (OMF) lipoprotein
MMRDPIDQLLFYGLRLRSAAPCAYMLLLTGCISMSGIFPQAKTKEANTLAPGKTIAAAANMAWPKDDWWQSYQDPQLNSLVTQSINGSPTLRAAQARVALSQAYAQTMQAATLPLIGADISTTRERFTELQFIPQPWAGHTYWNNKATASLAYDLDLWGRQDSIWRASVKETQAVAAEKQQVKLALETATVSRYVQLAMEFALRDVAEEHAHEVEQLISIVNHSYAAGLSTKMEVYEAETPLPLARAQIEAIDGRISLLRNQLAALTGQGPGAGDTITRPKLLLDVATGLPEQLPASLIGRRPDVLAYRWRVEAAQDNIAGAKAEFYPNINLIAFVGMQAIGFGQLISSAASIAGVGPAISLPIFDGGRRRGNLSAKTASYDLAVESYNEVLVNALQDVSDQLLMLQSNAKQRRQTELALAMASKAHTLAKTSYRAGLSNYLHVLSTHEVMLKQQEIIVQLQAMRLASYAGLMRSLGGGTIDMPVEAPSNTTSSTASPK